MKTITMNIGNGIEVTIAQRKRGQMKRFLQSLLDGKYEIYTFDVVEMSDKKKFLQLASDRDSNRGHWFAHCNGYMFDAVLDFRKTITLNTWTNYRRESKN